MIELVDAHCHINFFENAGEIALNCEKNNTHTIYVTTLPSQFDATYDYVKNLHYIYPSLGFHCLETECNIEKEKELFLKNIEYTKFIGEIGLDFSKKLQYSKEKQIDIFEFILKNIQNKNKIVSVHSLNAEDDVLKFLKKYHIKKAIFHWYTGKISSLNKIIESDYYFSINLAMCKSKRGQNIILKIPIDKILVETDSPFIKGILPYYNEYVDQYLSNIWRININEVKSQVLRNFIQLCE